MKHNPDILMRMIPLTEACRELGVPYDYIYGAHYLLWRPLLGLSTIRNHHYVERSKFQQVEECMKGGFIPAFKLTKRKITLDVLDACEKKIMGGVEWLKVPIDNIPQPKHRRAHLIKN